MAKIGRLATVAACAIFVVVAGSACAPDIASAPPAEATLFTAPVPAPPEAELPPEPTASTLPQPDVTGGGPLSADAAVARITAQLPEVATGIQLSGADALGYARKLVQHIPQVQPVFSTVDSIVTCGMNYGVIAMRVYIDSDFSSASLMMVLSHGQLQQLPQIALSCFVDSAVTGGGGTFAPCLDQYYYDRVTDGVPDRYFVVVAGTHTANCPALKDWHTPYSPAPIF